MFYMARVLTRPNAWPTDRLHEQDPARRPELPANAASEIATSMLQALSLIAERRPRNRDHLIRIRNFRSEKYELTEDLIVSLEEERGQYLAFSYDTGQYGYGLSPDDAIARLCSVLEDYYELLLEDRASLSDTLAGHLRYLETVLKEQ